MNALPPPLALLRAWIAEARDAGQHNPEAMALASVDSSGAPAVRMVLARGLDVRGVVFYTSYLSPKAEQLAATARAAAVFYWPAFERQARLAGAVERLAPAESDAYFAARPRGHRISAWASEQSRPIGSRRELEERAAAAEARFDGIDVPRPDWWGGLRIVPDEVELWQGRPDRLHEREQWRLGPEGWAAQLLMP